MFLQSMHTGLVKILLLEAPRNSKLPTFDVNLENIQESMMILPHNGLQRQIGRSRITSIIRSPQSHVMVCPTRSTCNPHIAKSRIKDVDVTIQTQRLDLHFPDTLLPSGLYILQGPRPKPKMLTASYWHPARSLKVLLWKTDALMPSSNLKFPFEPKEYTTHGFCITCAPHILRQCLDKSAHAH